MFTRLIISCWVLLATTANAWAKTDPAVLERRTVQGVEIAVCKVIGKMRFYPSKRNSKLEVLKPVKGDKTVSYRIAAKNTNAHAVKLECRVLTQITSDNGSTEQKELLLKSNLYPTGTHWLSPAPAGKFIQLISADVSDL